MKLNPYLMFDGRCEEAFTTYQKILGGEIVAMIPHEGTPAGEHVSPGWRKKMQPFPVAIERQLEPLPAGYARGVIDGHAVIYNPRTQVIFDIAVLF